MDYGTFNKRMNELIAEYITSGGSAAMASGLLFELADKVIDEPDEQAARYSEFYYVDIWENITNLS